MSEPTTDDECIEEEFLVFADFQTKISADILNDPDVKIKVIGFEEQHPIMQVNNKMFQGRPQKLNIVQQKQPLA